MRRLAAAAIASLIALGPTPARADAIDGDWCYRDGRQFSILGPRIVTPDGFGMTGNYTRHAFDYVVPAGEPGAGQTVDMRLLNELTVQLTVGASGAPEIWQRCRPPPPVS